MKKETIKLLKTIGVDTRYISYTPKTIYINNIRFSKFSRQKEETFKKYHPEIKIKRSSLLQKICTRSSKILSQELKPKDTVLLPKITDSTTKLIDLILEPYTRKYGIKTTRDETEKIDKIIGTLTLNIEAYNTLENIFEGKKLKKEEKTNPPIINPLINIPNQWINDFMDDNNEVNYPKKEYKEVTLEFMEFIKPIIPQYKENIINSKEFITEFKK